MAEYYLYMLVRNDLDSMTPGKAAAQVSHATNLFEDKYRALQFMSDQSSRDLCKAVLDWKKSAGGFGTCIVLSASYIRMQRVGEGADTPLRGIVVDPTYPVRDRSFTHYVNIETVAFLFAPKNNIWVQDLKLW